MNKEDKVVPFDPAAVAAGLPANTVTVATSAEPAGPSPGGPPRPPDDPSDAFETKPGLATYYFEESTGKFWLKNSAAAWIGLGEAGIKRELKKLGKRDKLSAAEVTAGKAITQMDEVLRTTEQDFRVAFAGGLAGYKAGLHTVAGRLVLVSRDPELIKPVKGEWPVLRAYFEGLFIGEETLDDESGKKELIDQTAHFYAWLRHAMESLYRGRITSGLALCVAGERDCGKSRLAMILKWCLGGYVAKPYAAMIGKDNFNRELFEAVLQLVDDENADTRIDARMKFAAEIKKIVANDDVKQRGMQRDGLTLSVTWRLVILVNLEPERLMVMPPIDNDIRDKLIMLKGYKRPEPPATAPAAERACWPMPMPSSTEDEKEAFRGRLRAELPAFLWWLLNEFSVPSHVAGGRFSVRHWQHPQILNRLQKFSPHVRLWQLIESSRAVFEYCVAGTATSDERWEERASWTGTARELHDVLKGGESRLTLDEKRKVPDPAWIGQRLEGVREHFGVEVAEQKRTKHKGVTGARVWTLNRRRDLAE